MKKTSLRRERIRRYYNSPEKQETSANDNTWRNSATELMRSVSGGVLYPLAAIAAIWSFGVYISEADERTQERALLNLDAKIKADEALARLPRPDHPGARLDVDDRSRMTADAVMASLLSTGFVSVGTTNASLKCTTDAPLKGEVYVGSYTSSFEECNLAHVGFYQNFIGTESPNSTNFVRFINSTVRDLSFSMGMHEKPATLIFDNTEVRESYLSVEMDDIVHFKNSQFSNVTLAYSATELVFFLRLPNQELDLKPMTVADFHTKYCFSLPIRGNVQTLTSGTDTQFCQVSPVLP